MKVPRHQKFPPAAEEIFRKVYLQTISKQRLIKHPKMPMIEQQHWQTICFNMAFISATAYEGKTMIVGDDMTPLMPEEK